MTVWGSHLGTAGPVGVDGAGAVTVRPGVPGLTQTLASPGVTPGEREINIILSRNFCLIQIKLVSEEGGE